MERGSVDNDEEHQHREAFNHNGISQSFREEINRIRNNDPEFETFELRPYEYDVTHFSDSAWELLGSYIANNVHLYHIALFHLMDGKMPLLFKNWTRAPSLESLHVRSENFGLDGIRSMLPFLKNSRSLVELEICMNDNINTECFRLLINSLHGGSIEELTMQHCQIDDITALENGALPHVRHLDFRFNNIQRVPSLEQYRNLETLSLEINDIGMQGCRAIAQLLQNQSSSLRVLNLWHNDITEEEAEILAHSLKHNTSLKELHLGGNDWMQERGHRAFLKLLNDASSIEKTYNSNHTLTKLNLPHLDGVLCALFKKHLKYARRINKRIDKQCRKISVAGREKVLQTQLHSNTRMELYHLQGIDYSYSSLFADIDPVLLPEILEITGRRHGKSEFYCMLIAAVPDLASIVNRKAVIKERIAKNATRMIALSAENLQLTKELASIESGENNLPADVGEGISLHGRGKRRRCASF